MSDTATTLDRQVNGLSVPTPGTYAIDVSHSTVQAVAKHMLVSKVRVGFTDFQGTITVGEEPEDSAVQVALKAASINSRDDNRDAHLRSGDFLDAETFPEITFRSTDISPAWTISGDLTIRDTTRPVVLDTEYLGTLKSPMGPTVAVFSASTSINREAFDITWNAPMEAGGVLVGKDVRIELEIQAVLQEG
ncbi:MAG TPA: YceI family protein [Euzebya sp.]|nr:YceI family protein [Euzebya sp.]